MSSSTRTSTPTIRNKGTAPATRHKLFVNIPVRDLQRSIDFFEALGFNFNPQFTDATATCMLVGEDAYFMLLTRERFADFVKRPVGDAGGASTIPMGTTGRCSGWIRRRSTSERRATMMTARGAKLTHYEVFLSPALVTTALPLLSGGSKASSWAGQMKQEQ